MKLPNPQPQHRTSLLPPASRGDSAGAHGAERRYWLRRSLNVRLVHLSSLLASALLSIHVPRLWFGFGRFR